jgi:hypothetical protein
MLIAPIAAPDTMYMRAGEQEAGTLEKMTADSVTFKGHDGEKTVQKSELASIQLQQARQHDDIENAAQITDPDLKACLENQPDEKAYPADESLTLFSRESYDLSESGTAKETNRCITKILRQRGENAGSVNVWFFEDTDSVKVDFALTVTPDGRVLHLDDAAVKVESIYANMPTYRRLSRVRFACKEPRPGAVLDVQYTVIRKRDPVLEPFYNEEAFRSDTPILHKETHVVFPEAVNDMGTKYVNYQVVSPEPNLIDVSMSEGGKELVFRLTKPMPGYISEPLMPPIKEFAPTVTITAATTWIDMSKAYAEILEKVAPISDGLKSKAVELAKTGGPAAIHDFVARGIRSVPAPQLRFRFTPRAPDEIVKSGVANELDKNYLYFRMLEAAGIDSSFALLRDRNLGCLSEAAPSFRALNRAAVYLRGEKRFSSATSDIVSYKTLEGELQDAPALPICKDGSDIVRTQSPALEDEVETRRFSASLAEDGSLDLALTYLGTGNSEMGLRALKDLDEQQMRNQMEQIAASVHPGAKLSKFKTTDLADLAVPPEITLSCSIPGFAFKAGEDLMLLDLPLIQYDAGDVGRPTREYALFWANESREICEGVIRLPKGFKAYSLPKNLKTSSKYVSYRAKLHAGKGEIVFKDQSDVKALTAPREAYGDYKEFKEIRAHLSKQRLILTK